MTEIKKAAIDLATKGMSTQLDIENDGVHKTVIGLIEIVRLAEFALNEIVNDTHCDEVFDDFEAGELKEGCELAEWLEEHDDSRDVNEIFERIKLM